MNLTVEVTNQGDYFLIVNGVVIGLNYNQKTLLFKALGPAKEVDGDKKTGYFRYFYS